MAHFSFFSLIIFSLKSLQLFDYLTNRRIKKWIGHEKDITKVTRNCFYFDLILIVFIKNIKRCLLRTLKVLYCPVTDRYISASRDRTIKTWNANSDKFESSLHGHELVVTAISCDPENKYLISGSRDNCLKLWDLNTCKLVASAQISRNLVIVKFFRLYLKIEAKFSKYFI